MSKPKILLLSDFKNYGGVKTYFLRLVEFLFEEQVQLDIILYSKKVLTKNELEFIKDRGGRIRYLPSLLKIENAWLKKMRINKLLQFIYLCFLSLKSYDKVILSTGNPFSFFSGIWIWRNKFYYVLHTYPHHYSAPDGLKAIFQYIRDVYHQLIKFSNFTLITVSEASKKEIIRYLKLSYDDLNIKVIYNPASPQVHNSSEQTKKENLVVTLGHVKDYKNPHFWLTVAKNVVKKIDNTTFVWAGDGPLLKEMQNKVPEKLKKRIKFIGRVNEVEKLLNKAVIYFQPSLVESHGISVVEAMSCALPCIVSNCGGLPESVDDGKTGYVIGLECNIATKKILYLINNKDRANEMGKAAYTKFLDKFSPTIWKNKMKELLFYQ